MGNRCWTCGRRIAWQRLLCAECASQGAGTGAKRRSARFFLPGPFLGPGSLSASKGPRGLLTLVRALLRLSLRIRSLITPTCPLYRDLESRGVRSLALGIPFAVALEPDFEAFFGGMEAAVATGGVLVIVLVVVTAVKRITRL